LAQTSEDIMQTTVAVIRPEQLLAAGYRRFHDPTEQAHMRESYLGSYGKQIRDERGIKYALHFSHTRIRATGYDSEGMTASTQFRRGVLAFNVHMLNDVQTLAEVEAFFEEMFRAMKVDYYELIA
jgi:hypothetical protein